MTKPTGGVKKTKILECTLRDGSYAIDFQFSEQDTKDIVSSLIAVGIDTIEIGHGLGLGASEKGHGVAAETDEVYLRAAAAVAGDAQWGMFCIPGIAELEQLDMAADYGMKFVRIGTNADACAKSRPFIERAKKHGMAVYSNFMKSYCCAPEDFARYAVEAREFGADLVYIVDSAGAMFPENIEEYALAVRAVAPSLPLGFHGHHNLGLGVSNALKAVELGFELVDSSLQGMGRSAGNTSTEQLVSCLVRKGIDMNIDPIAVMDVGEKYIKPLIQVRGLSSLDIVAGLSYFHSSFMPTIERYARQYRLDPRKLIIALCEQDRKNAPPELVEKLAIELDRRGEHGCWKPLYRQYFSGSSTSYGS